MSNLNQIFDSPTLEQLTSALPTGFDFYHLGKVKIDTGLSVPIEELDETDGVAFQLHGDTRGIVAVLFDRGLDVSTYTEMGNVIASQMATRLSEGGRDILISPPHHLSRNQILKLAKQATPTSVRTYYHINSDPNPAIALIQAWVFASSLEETVNV